MSCNCSIASAVLSTSTVTVIAPGSKPELTRRPAFFCSMAVSRERSWA
jgi:hypothetical protein